MTGHDTPTVASVLRAPRVAGSRGGGRRDATRREICSAANELFVQQGLAAVTMEEIARAAAVGRSTLYTYFADKEQILAAIGAEYVIEVCEVIRRLPGPAPTEDEIAIWLDGFAAFVTARPGPAELVLAAGRQADPSPASIAFGLTMLRCFAERFPAFEIALQPAEGFRRAWANATLGELGAALTYRARYGDGAIARDALAVVAMLLTRFIRQDR